MNRLLLTLLALLTGMVAQVTPAAAAVNNGNATEIGSSEVRVAAQIAAAATGGFSCAQAIRPRLSRTPLVGPIELLPPVRTVLTGIDRARE